MKKNNSIIILAVFLFITIITIVLLLFHYGNNLNIQNKSVADKITAESQNTKIKITGVVSKIEKEEKTIVQKNENPNLESQNKEEKKKGFQAKGRKVWLSSYIPLSEDESIDRVTTDFQEICTYFLPTPFPIPAHPLMIKPFLADIAIKKDFSRLLAIISRPDFHPIDEPQALNEIVNQTVFYMVLVAAELDKRDCVNVLLANGADIKSEYVEGKKRFSDNRNNNAIIESGKNLLHCAAQNGNITLAKKVLEAGIDVNKPTKLGNTPLWFAITNNQIDMAELLIKSGAKLDENLISLATDSAMLEILKNK